MSDYICHDCGRKLKENEEYVGYNSGKNIFIKCRKCHEKDPVLRNYQKTEVYSRVVGYIRPIEQWNKGKKEEFGDRREFVVDPACC